MKSPMEMIVLGSGSAFPSRRPSAVRNPAGYAVRVAGSLILMDLGFGNLRQLFRAGLDASELTDIFVSHRHPDHIGDLPALLFLLRYDITPKCGRLRLWGPAGFSQALAGLRQAHRPWCEPRGFDLEIGELRDGEEVAGSQWRMFAHAVNHPTPALAYRFSYRGRSLVYSGDTGFSPGLADFAAESDLFLLECTIPTTERAQGHLTPPVALATLEASACRRGLLTHLSDASAAELRRLIKRGQPYSLAFDLMRVKI